MSRLSSGEREFVSDFGGLDGPDPQAGRTAGMPGTEIDARGISSPLHILRAHRALRAMQPGQQLKVVTSSPQTVAEFQALVKHVVGYELVAQEQVGDEFVHVLRKRR